MAFDPLYLFVFFGVFSPGPNVILLTASGARFGVRRTVPHVIGVTLGVGVIAALSGLGIGALLKTVPALELALKIAAAIWILWMAWKLWTSTSATRTRDKDRPFTFIEAVLFQWVNPKAWAITLAAATGFPSDLAPLAEAARLASAFSGINLFVCVFWSVAGSLLAYLLTTQTAWQAFTRIMAALLALSAAMVFL